MRILIHSLYFSPDLTGIGKYSGEMAEWLSKSGNQVRVVAGLPFYPHWKVAAGYSRMLYVKETAWPDTLSKNMSAGSLTVYRCPLWIPSVASGLKRLLHLASFALTSFPVMLMQIFWRPNIVIVVVPPLFCAPQASLVAKLSGAKAWLHVQDFEVDAAFDLGIIKANWLRQSVLFAEQFLLRRFDRVSTVSINMEQKLIEKSVKQELASQFPNWVDSDEIFPLSSPSKYRKELGIDEAICVALYSGNMGEKQGLEVVIEAARQCIGNAKVLFVLCGDGVARSKLMLQAEGLVNIRWIPLQPTDCLNELLNLADIHLLPQRVGMGDLMMPSKLLGMLASGRPVIAMAEQGTQLESEVLNCGIVLKPGDIDGLTAAIKRLAKMKHEREVMGEAARIGATKWSKKSVLSAFEAELQRL